MGVCGRGMKEDLEIILYFGVWGWVRSNSSPAIFQDVSAYLGSGYYRNRQLFRVDS